MEMNNLCITRVYQETEVNWKIHDIFASSEYGNCCFFISETFSFADTTWRLLLASKTSDDSESSKFTFMSTDPCKFSVEYTFHLKKQDGNLVQIASGNIESNQKRCENHYIKLKQILKPIPKFVIISGLLKARTEITDEPKPKKLKKLETLSENFFNLYTNEQCCDVTLNVSGKKCKVHKALLIARSPVFAAMFQHDTSESQTGIINIEDCDPDTFPEFLKFLYCGKTDSLTYSSAYNLYATSEKYNIEELKSFCREHLMETLQLDTWSNVYAMAELHNDKQLMTAAQDFFHKNLLQIFKSSQWEDFMKENPQLACKLLKQIPENKIVK